VLTQWLNAGYIDKNQRFETIRGTPQGGPALGDPYKI
jgi:RNA-directed DNA polymerase